MPDNPATHSRLKEAVWAERLTLAAGIASIVLLISPLFRGLFGPTSSEAKSRAKLTADVLSGLTNFLADHAKLIGDVNRIRITLASATNPAPDFKLLLAITDTASQVSNVSGRVKSLEDAIVASPDKALAIPMIRKDVDFLQKSQVDDRVALKAELERLYDFNKWFFGLIATMALTILGLALSNAFKKSKDAEPEA